MRIVRTAAFVLVVSALSACTGPGITGTEPSPGLEPGTAGAIQPQPSAPRKNGGFIGSGT